MHLGSKFLPRSGAHIHIAGGLKSQLGSLAEAKRELMQIAALELALLHAIREQHFIGTTSRAGFFGVHWRHTGAQVNNAVTLENVMGGFLVNRRQDSEMRNHEDTVHGKSSDAFGLESVDEQRRRLIAVGSVGQNTAAAN